MRQIAERRQHILQLLIMACGVVAALVLALAYSFRGTAIGGDHVELDLMVRGAWFGLVSLAALYALRKRMPTALSGGLFIGALILAIPLTDSPQHVVEGRAMLWFALPIVAASVVIRPWASWLAAGLAAVAMAAVGMTQSPPVLNLVGTLGMGLIAMVSWYGARSLESSLRASEALAARLAESQERYRGIFDNSLNGISIHELIRDDNGDPFDYRFLQINDAFEDHTGFVREEVIGRTAREIIPGIEELTFISTYGRVVDTGEPASFEQYSPPLDRTFDIAALRMGRDQFVTIFSDISERARHDKERERLLADMRRQADELHSVLEAVPVAVLMLDESGQVLMANGLAEELLADAAELEDGHLLSLAGQPLDDLTRGPARRYWQGLDAGDRRLEVTVRSVDETAQVGCVLVVRDVTQQRDFERRLQQQDRLAVIGQLAGGIAHDFNNLLTSILGFADFALESAEPDTHLYDDISEVRAAGLRAAALTQQLLAFSRRQLLKPRTVSLCDIIREMRRMLGGLLEETIELSFELTADAGNISVDPVQIQQVIMNLSVNARDAMPEGGRLTIGVQNVSVPSPASGPDVDVPPGEYVMLSVADTGIGMSDEVQQHLFEPFYTTKDVGKGTGLGLATVYGIVRQSEAHIAVQSAPGQGTMFRLYFPPAGDADQASLAGTGDEAVAGGDEVILVVEDEAAVRRLARRELESLGYVVLEAEKPSVALALARAAQTIDLLLTDVVMPEMDGAALAIEIRKERPGLKVLYVSGYTDRNLDQIAPPGSGARFMEKPYKSHELAAMVRAILDQA